MYVPISTARKTIPKYIWDSFDVHVAKMKAMNKGNGIWLNIDDLKQYPSFNVAMRKLLGHFNLSNVSEVQRYESGALRGTNTNGSSTAPMRNMSNIQPPTCSRTRLWISG